MMGWAGRAGEVRGGVDALGWYSRMMWFGLALVGTRERNLESEERWMETLAVGGRCWVGGYSWGKIFFLRISAPETEDAIKHL